MHGPASIILAIALALGSTEGLAYWWMHPAPTDLTQPVLCYRPDPSRSAGVPPASSIHDPQSSSDSSTDHRSLITDHSSSFTPLPEIYNKSAPMLRCSGGQVFHVKFDETINLHLAFFEWNHTDTGSVLEAFRHMPEACLGSIGMTLVSQEKPIPYQVDGETLLFDHTIFRDPAQARAPLVHAFRAIWVASVANVNTRGGLAGTDPARLRTIRLQSALTRFRPAYARVIQGAVRGAANPDQAWQAFENTMLCDLTFETR